MIVSTSTILPLRINSGIARIKSKVASQKSQGRSLSVPELVEGPEPLPFCFDDAFKAYALRGIFAFPC